MPMPTAAHELVLTRLIKAWQREGRADASGSALLFNGLGLPAAGGQIVRAGHRCRPRATRHGQIKSPGLVRGAGPGFSASSGAGGHRQQGSSPMQQAAPATQQAAPAANTWADVLNSSRAEKDFRILDFMKTSRG